MSLLKEEELQLKMEVREQPKTKEENNSNYQKICLFLQHNQNTKPDHSSSLSITQLLREYLNDDDFTIFYEGEQVFKNEGYSQKLQNFYRFWRAGVKQNGDIDEFVKCWIKNENQLHVQYSLFDDFQRQNEQKHRTNDIQISYQPRNQRDEIKENTNQDILRGTERNPQASSSLSKGLLEYFYTFYCKKETNRQSNSTFEQYQQFYNEMNLTKWMWYTKDIGLGSFQKILPTRTLKHIFVKRQNNRKCLNFEAFQAAVESVLQIIYKGNLEQINTEGHELLGIKSVQNFKNKFRELGLLPPPITKNKITKRDQSSKKITQRQKNYQNISNSTISLCSLEEEKVPSALSRSNHHNSSNNHNSSRTLQRTNKVILEEIKSSKRNEMTDNVRATEDVRETVMKAEQSLKSSVGRSKLLNKVRVKDDTLKQIVQDEDDPYLRRYNHKQNINAYHSIIHRIDERVQKMCTKY